MDTTSPHFEPDKVLTIPNWSFGRDRDLLQIFRDLLASREVQVHYVESDLDHNRTVTAFSGEIEVVFERLERLAEAAFDRLDLNRHVGVHPRIGALDVCPFVRLGAVTPGHLEKRIDEFGDKLASRFNLPVYLYEKSERGRHPNDLPTLRKGGFGGLLIEPQFVPDFGPHHAHPRLGAVIMGERDFLIALNVNFDGDNTDACKQIAKRIRDRRRSGEPEFAGVRALGFYLRSRNQVQVSLNITMPDKTAIDPIVRFVLGEAERKGLRAVGTELIGVIRDVDMDGAKLIRPRPEQVVPWPSPKL